MFTCTYSVDACSLSLDNPCTIGSCVNDGKGSYSCICPPGYTQGNYTTGAATCIYDGEQHSSSANKDNAFILNSTGNINPAV